MDAVTESLRNHQNDEAKLDRQEARQLEIYDELRQKLSQEARDNWATIGPAIFNGLEFSALPESGFLARLLVEAVNNAIDDYAWRQSKV